MLHALEGHVEAARHVSQAIAWGMNVFRTENLNLQEICHVRAGSSMLTFSQQASVHAVTCTRALPI